MRRYSLVSAACALALATGCAPRGRPGNSSASTTRRREISTSNVTRSDYVGSAACAPCHPDVTESWEHSPMHRMTRIARGADILTPFDGRHWRFKGDELTLDTRGGERFVRIDPAGGAAQTYRVTRVIGGRTREDFAGVSVDDPSGELVLPFSYLIDRGTFRYKGYSVMIHERTGLRAGPPWAKTCIFCHNTIPEIDRLLGAIAGAFARPYQGESVDRWLSPQRRSVVRVTDAAAFARVMADEMAHVHGGPTETSDDPRRIAASAIHAVRAGFDATSLVETGIGCEACHGGARAHLRDASIHPSFVPQAPWLEVDAPRATHALAVNRACARCHQVLFSGYPYTWEGGRRDADAGGSHISSGEARDFLLGACSDAMDCTACHDPHGGQDRRALDALSSPAGNATCTRCHRELGDAARLRAHAHHDPSGAGGACIACHMPRKNMGLRGRLTVYHRIGSPTDPARVLGDRPIECALCHVDRSVRSLVDQMEAWWPERYPRQRLEELYGSLDANVVRATLERGKPHEKAVALALLGEHRDRDAIPLVARELGDEYPLVREWALEALRDIVGRCDVDLNAGSDDVARAVRACAGAAAVVPPASAPDRAPSTDPDAED